MADGPLVRVAGLTKRFGDFVALDDVTLGVAAGGGVVVLGASGSGKSTLCRCINRLEGHDAGTIAIDGVPLPEEGKELARLGAEVPKAFPCLIQTSRLPPMQHC